jgi:hypothetical protein
MSLNKRLISGEKPEPGPARFRPLLFTGNGGSKSVTGMGFKPDLVWIKDRDDTSFHTLFDSIIGATKRIFTNSTNAEDTVSNF